MKDTVYNFKINSVMDIAQVTSGIQQIQNQLNGLKVPAKLGGSISTVIKSLETELTEYERLTSTTITSDKEFKAVDDSLKTILGDWQKLTNLMSQVKGIELDKLIPEKTINQINKASSALKEYDKEIEKVGRDADAVKKKLDKAQETLNTNQSKRDALAEENRKLGSRLGAKTKQLYGADGQSGKLQERTKLKETIKSSGGNLKDDNDYVKLNSEVENLIASLDKLQKTIGDNQKQIDSLDSKIKVSTKDVANFNDELTKIKNEGNVNAFEKLRQAIADIQFGGDITKVPQDLQQIKNIVEQMSPNALNQIKQALDKTDVAADGTSDALKNIVDAVHQMGDGINDIKRTNKEIDRLAQQVEYFFGLQNMIYLFKDAVRQAFETVKELDEAMTETAVVTDFSVGDMWEALPKYTAAANELGTTTLGAYETMTLYYQQGLKTNEVFEIGTETMKMAR